MNYPVSCDQNEYFSGFKDFEFIILTDHAYQQRPLYIFLVYILNLLFSPLFSLLNINETFGILISVFLIHSFVLNYSLLLIMKLINIKKIKYFDLFFIVILNLLHPMAKWEIFEANNWMFTLLQIVLPVYLMKGYGKLTPNIAFVFGLLFLIHRGMIVSFLTYIFLVYAYKERIKIVNIIKNLLIFTFPFALYRGYFIINNLKPFDTNTENFRQFVWIIDYFTWGGDRKYGEYFCQRIPGFIKCYFDGTINLINYMSVPFIISIICLVVLYKKNNKHFQWTIITFLSLYSFWSLTGWYPMRFIYYSLGVLINFLLIYGYFKLNKNYLSKALYSLPLITYFSFLTMWNNPDPDKYIDDQYIYYSLFILFIYFLYNYKFIYRNISKKSN
tara:strand:+ start:198 stop:1358 length:1161 start_codon:yes stop_codon:yes gene_type:complete